MSNDDRTTGDDQGSGGGADGGAGDAADAGNGGERAASGDSGGTNGGSDAGGGGRQAQPGDEQARVQSEQRASEPEPEPRREAPAEDRSIPFAAGAFTGLAAYVLGYLITYVVSNSAIRNSVIGDIAGNDTWRAVGWIFYNAHYVDTVGELSGFGLTVSRAVNFISTNSSFPEWLFVVPPILLLVAGGIVGARAAAGADIRFGAISGLTVVPGYLATALVGAFLFRVTEGSATVGPEPVTAAFLAGIVYPIVLCTLGAVVVSLVYPLDGR